MLPRATASLFEANGGHGFMTHGCYILAGYLPVTVCTSCKLASSKFHDYDRSGQIRSDQFVHSLCRLFHTDTSWYPYTVLNRLWFPCITTLSIPGTRLSTADPYPTDHWYILFVAWAYKHRYWSVWFVGIFRAPISTREKLKEWKEKTHTTTIISLQG